MRERWEAPREGSEKEPETVRLQAVGVERRRRAFCIMSLRVAMSGKAKGEYARSRSESEPE